MQLALNMVPLCGTVVIPWVVALSATVVQVPLYGTQVVLGLVAPSATAVGLYMAKE